MSEPLIDAPFRRLHPTTLVQRFVRSLPGYAILLLPVLRGTGSWWFVGMALTLAVVSLPALVLGYLRFRYRLTPDEVQIERGVLSRERRSIPLERIQRVEIDQPLLPRAFGTARVQLMTGSGSGAEGSLEFVTLAEAQALRAAVRRLQAVQRPAAEPVDSPREGLDGEAVLDAASPEAASDRHALSDEAAETLPIRFVLTPGLLLRAGAMRFSLVYIALAFSGMQFIGLTVNDIIEWFERGDYLTYVPLLTASPMLAVVVSIGLALGLSWVAGLLTTTIRYHDFTLRDDGDKLFTARGLGGRYERTIPRPKVQAVLYSSNPIMRRFGYARLDVQTMGLGEGGVGREALAPLERSDRLSALGTDLLGYGMATALQPVSRLFIRRRALRYSLQWTAATALAAWAWTPLAWALAALPLMPLLAWWQWRAHGFTFDGETLVVQRGAFRRMQWHVPISKVQSADLEATVFQRRLGLATVGVDTAGGPGRGGPYVEDLTADDARALYDAILARRFALSRSAGRKTEAQEPEPTAEAIETEAGAPAVPSSDALR